jgi:hypothetical protein
MQHLSKSGAITAVLIAFVGTCLAESPVEFAYRFCRSEDAFGRGVPSIEHQYDHLVGMEMIRAIRAANSAVEDWMHRHRDSKENLMIPHIEANLFSGFSEGPTTFKIGRATITSGRVSVAIHREYQDRGETYAWTDTLILDRDSSGWVAYDLQTHYFGSLIAYLDEFRESVGVFRSAHRPKPKPNRVEVTGLRLSPLPHHSACGFAPGGSSQITEL